MARIDQNKQRVIYRPFKRSPKILETTTTTTVTTTTTTTTQGGTLIEGFHIAVPLKETGEIEKVLVFRTTVRTAL